MKEELADVVIYSLSLANTLELDVVSMVQDKIQMNAEKYPVEMANGSNKKYNVL